MINEYWLLYLIHYPPSQVHRLEIEYAQKYAPLYQQRADIVSGVVEPSASDCVMPGEEQDNEKIDNDKQVILAAPELVILLI